jgi:succinate dehydrogenase/fumarate reductase flavoprotein subunit
MRNALETVLDLRDNGLPKVEVGGGKIFNTDWRAAIEISMALGLAELVIRAALLRKETRGHHFRADFPETLERPQHTLIRRRGHEVRVMVTPVRKLGS